MLKEIKIHPFSFLFESLKSRIFRLLLFSNFFSITSLWLQITVLYLYVLNLTNSAGKVGLVGFVSTLPFFLFGLLGGYLADKFNGKTILSFLEYFSFLSSLTMTILLFFNLNHFWIAYIAVFFLGIRFPLTFPSFRLMIRLSVKTSTLTNSMALEAASWQLGKLLGPVLAGFLILELNFAYALLAGTIMTLISCFLIQKLPSLPKKENTPQRSSNKKTIDQVASLLKNPYLLGMLLTTLLFNFFIFTYEPMVSIISKETLLTANPFLIGVLIASAGLGGLMGAGLMALFNAPHKLFFFVFILGCFISSIALLTFSISKVYLLSIACLIFVGIGQAIFATMQSILIYSNTPKSLQGKMFGALIVVIGGSPFGFLSLSYLAETKSAEFALQIHSLLGILFFILISTYVFLFIRLKKNSKITN